jgi:uncharacterized protein
MMADCLSKKKIKAVELGVFLLLIAPSSILSGMVLKPNTLTFMTVALSTIFQDIALLSLILFFIWRNRESLSDFGISYMKAEKEILLGVGLFIPLLFILTILNWVLKAFGLSVPQKPPSFLIPGGEGQIVLAVFFLITVAISEEVIFRGYIINRLISLTGNKTAAILLSSFLFTLGHGYEHIGGMIGVGLLGILFAIVYIGRGNLIAPIIMHFLQDFIGILLIS